MASYSIYGDLLDTNLRALRVCVKEALNIEYLNEAKSDIYIENDIFSLYIYDYASPYPSGNWDFLINIGYESELLQEVIDFLKKLVIGFHQYEIVYNFEFYKNQEGEVDQEKSYIIRHPDFGGSPDDITIHVDGI